jgi:hypothetical protein
MPAAIAVHRAFLSFSRSSLLYRDERAAGRLLLRDGLEILRAAIRRVFDSNSMLGFFLNSSRSASISPALA